MAKFHIDPAGNPGLCRATKRCPYGSLENDHFSSEAAARKSYELENTYSPLVFSDEAKAVLREVGPRQLPNRAWSALSSALQRDRFSEHDVNIALTAATEEWDKLTNITSKSPYQWGDEEIDAAEKLSEISTLTANAAKVSNLFKTIRLQAIKDQFGAV